MMRHAALALCLTVPWGTTGCAQEGSGEAKGSVRLEVVNSVPGKTLTTDWDPEPDYFGTVRNASETVTEYGSVPVGTYTVTATQDGKSATAAVEVTEGETAEVSVTLD